MILIIHLSDNSQQVINTDKFIIQTPERKLRVTNDDDYLTLENIPDLINAKRRKPLQVFKEDYKLKIK